MISFWETLHFTEYDFIVIGSGITGLSLAAELKENKPDCSVLVLEKGIFPSGASTKNAGFACFGSVSELLSDIHLMGEEAVYEMVQNRMNGLAILRNRLSDKKIDFQLNGGYELILNEDITNIKENINCINNLVFKLFNKGVYCLKNELIQNFGFEKKSVKALIYNSYEGQIDTGLMINSLIKYVTSLGVKIITGADVINYELVNDKVELFVKNTSEQSVLFKSPKVAFCTNAFTKQFFPDLFINPGRGQVLVTNPIKNLKIKGTFHFQEGYFYFRNFNDRVIFGGGRNIDFKMESTTAFGINPFIQNQLISYLKEIIIPNIDFTIDSQWSGIMAFGPNKLPIVNKINDNLFVGARLNGMGIAIGSNIAKELAQKMLR